VVVFRDLRYMVGDFFELSVVLALLRVTVEMAGLAEPARRKRREAREDTPS